MAESFEVVDESTLHLTIRDGVTFTDGTPYDAEAVRAGLLRTLNEASDVAEPSQSVAFKSITDITVDGPLELTISLGEPAVGELIAALADREGAIVSPTQAAEAPDQIDTNPVGAGPYLAEQITAEQIVSVRKNPDYYEPDAWPLGGVDFVHVADGAGAVAGLLSDTLDMAEQIPQIEGAALEGDGDVIMESLFTDSGYMALNVCSGKPPFDSEDARRALNIGMDRETAAELVYAGNAAPALGLWPEGSANYNPELEEVVPYDPEEAQSLFESAGVTEFDLWLPVPNPTYQRLAQVLQAQYGELGVTANIIVARDVVAEMITAQAPGVLMVPGSRSGVDKYQRVFDEGQVQALCGVTRPEIMEVLAPASALPPGSEEASALFQEADMINAEGSFYIPIVFTGTVTAWASDRVGGEAEFYGHNAQPMLDTFYIKQ
jgi:ABC-type transport system substrate-binding protein